MKQNQTERNDAEWIVRKARKIISPKSDFLNQLDLWGALKYSIAKPEDHETNTYYQQFVTNYGKELELRGKYLK